MEHSQDRETLSLRGDIQFRVSLVPRGVTEEPEAFIELWSAKNKNKQGRLSVPKFIATASEELQCVMKSRGGRSIFIGPIKVHLRNEGFPRDNIVMKRKIAVLEKKQSEMQTLLEKMSVLLQNQMVEDPSPLSSQENSGELESKAGVALGTIH